MILIFWCLGILVGSCNNSSDVSEVNGSHRVYPHFHLTRLLDGDLNDQYPDLKEVEVDDLEEVVDKPSTTTGTKMSVFH